MNSFKLKPILLAIGISYMIGISNNVAAQLTSPKLAINSINNDTLTAYATFPTPVKGDLYLATVVGGQLYFMGPGLILSPTKLVFQSNSSYSANITVLNIPIAGIAPGTYPLYQVVTAPGADVNNANNWIGGLSEIDFQINLNNTPPVVTPVVGDPTVIALGKTKYKSLGCSAGGCHTSNPASNASSILKGTTVAALKASFAKDPINMGYAANPGNAQFASDINLQAIAAYLSTF